MCISFTKSTAQDSEASRTTIAAAALRRASRRDLCLTTLTHHGSA